MKTGLVLEGGALRTIFSSGVCDAFLNEKLPMPDYTIGVSAGIAYGVSYLSRQKRRNLQLLMHYANDRRYMGWGNFFDPRNRSYFGLKFAYDTIPNELVPFDYDTFEAYPGQVEAVVTNLQTGRAEYREVPRRDASFLLLQATCAMPVLFQPIRLDDGAPYLDGGCSDAIPWKRALAVGCEVKDAIPEMNALLQRILPLRPLRDCGFTEADFKAFPLSVEANQQRLMTNAYYPFDLESEEAIYRKCY